MIITAKFASTCPKCSLAIAIGSKVEWSKGSKAAHVACAGRPATASVRVAAPRSARYYGGSRSRKCVSGGNCSSFGSGRSCGADDCDGH
jgi:hypothetical protein